MPIVGFDFVNFESRGTNRGSRIPIMGYDFVDFNSRVKKQR